MESGSTRGAASSMSRRIALETSPYRCMRPGSQTASGHRRAAISEGIADRTPNFRASYEHVATTPRRPGCPTITGRPRSAGFSRTSTEA
jgi:hypothetical protein